MACRLAGAKPLSEAALLCCQLDQWKQKISEILIEIYTFSFKIMHLKISSVKWRPFCLGPNVNMDKMFMLVYSRSVTMPELAQNWSLLPALGPFRHRVSSGKLWGEKNCKGTCVGPTLSWLWVDIGRAMSAQRRFAVGLMSPADVAPTSVRPQSQYLYIIIKTNRNVRERNAMIHFCPQRNWIMTTDCSMLHASLWSRCKQFLAAKNRLWCTRKKSADVAQMKSEIGFWIHE